MKKAQRNVQRVNREIKSLIRAAKVEKQRTKADDRRAALFFDRYWKKHVDVVRTEMPFADDGDTVGDWLKSRLAAGKEMPGLPALRKVFVSLGPRSAISDRKFWLFVLRCYAANGGARLGLERLSALAYCAHPDSNLNARTLARFFASISPNSKVKCLRDFRTLPAPPLLPPHN